jgi:hypothetical protein
MFRADGGGRSWRSGYARIRPSRGGLARRTEPWSPGEAGARRHPERATENSVQARLSGGCACKLRQGDCVEATPSA